MPARVLGALRAPARPALGRLGLAALAGALVAAGQAPLGFWWLALPALAAVTGIVAAAETRARAIWLGWAAGAGYFAAALFWIVEPFFVEPERYGWMAPFALVFMAGGMALFWALAGGLSRLGGGSTGARALAFAVGLAATDLLRSYVLTGFPWALAGHIWIGTPVMQAAAWVGPIGLSAVTTLAAALPLLAAGRGGRLALAGVSALAVGGL